MTAGFISMWVAKREFFNVIPEEKFHYFAKWECPFNRIVISASADFQRAGSLLNRACELGRILTYVTTFSSLGL